MGSEQVFYLVHIHTQNMDFYAIRDSLENAQEEVFEHAQGNWSRQFPNIQRPASKPDVIKQYFDAVGNSEYFHVVDISSEGNWVMENSYHSSSLL